MEMLNPWNALIQCLRPQETQKRFVIHFHLKMFTNKTQYDLSQAQVTPSAFLSTCAYLCSVPVREHDI